ncbi:hypothetical protein KAX17_14200 [Candidatus Bipolaricaulota bacterium]|nr:hypothetical protein [Candidatus Bipolaricaulota bacterium]
MERQVLLSGESGVRPPFSVHVTYKAVERALQTFYTLSRNEKTLHIDLSQTGRITPLATCMLYCWAYDVHSLGGVVELTAPRGGSHATSLFSSARILESIDADERIARVNRDSRMGARARYLSSFRVFPSDKEFGSYMAGLSSPTTRKALLNADNDYQILSSGDFCDVIIRELVGNSFVHAQGRGSHYCAYGYESSGDTRDELLANFPKPKRSEFLQPSLLPMDTSTEMIISGPGYIEVSVADSHPANLYFSLNRAKANGQVEFDYWHKEREKLTSHDLMILHAFNYASTSNEDERINRIRDYVSSWDPNRSDVSAIATGLYRLRRIAELYGGQIIIRTDHRIGTIDFTQDSIKGSRPRVAFLHRVNGKPLARLRGTIICVRVPVVKLPGKKRAVSLSTTQRDQGKFVSTVHIVAPPVPLPESWITDPTRGIAELEKSVRATLVKADSSGFVVVVLDGLLTELDIPRNSIIALVDVLSLIPRKCGLALVIDNDELVEEARKAYDALKRNPSANPIEERSGLVVVGSQFGASCVFGELDITGATALDTGFLIGPRGAKLALEDLPRLAREERLRQVLHSSEIRDAKRNYLYLIPNQYYLNQYFDITRMQSLLSVSATLRQWLLGEIRNRKPSVVVANSPFLVSELRRAAEMTLIQHPDCHLLSSTNTLHLAGKCSEACGEHGKVLVVLDSLIPPDKPLIRFLEALSVPSQSDVLVLVDGRESSEEPLQIREGSGYAQLDVNSLVSQPLVPIVDRGATPADRIIQVDPETHALVRYAFSGSRNKGEPSVETEQETQRGIALLERVDEANVLMVGHFELQGRHYNRFFVLGSLFRLIEDDIHEWLTKVEIDDIQKSDVPRDKIQPYCLDEDSGLYGIAARSMLDCGIRPILPLPKPEQDVLNVGPVGKAGPLWFILPALIDGSTLIRCLEFAAANGSEYVRISVIVDRAKPSMQAFIKGVNRYRGVNVGFGHMYSIPLSIPRGPCWLCSLEATLRIAARATREAKLPHLHSIVDSARNSLQPIAIETAGEVGTQAIEARGSTLGKEFAVRSLYERGSAGDVEARWLLRENLKDMRGYDALACAASTGPRQLFAFSTVNNVLYEGSQRDKMTDGPNLADACEAWAKRDATEHNPASFARELRGFALLDRFTLMRNLPGLFERLAINPVLMGELIAHAVSVPYLYIDTVEGIDPDIADDEQISQALRQLKKYLMNTGSRISVLYNLSFHLEHSTGWDVGIRDLRRTAISSTSDHQSVAIACETFLHRGLYEAARLIAILRSERYWQALPNGRQLDKLWDNVHSLATIFVESIGKGELGINQIETGFTELSQAKKKFVSSLNDAVGIPPQTLELMFRERIGPQLWPEGSVVIEAPRDCRAIACGQDDLREIIHYLLDNARHYSTEKHQLVTSLRFHPVPGTSPRIQMEVSQNFPAEIPVNYWELGGLRTVDRLITAASGVPPILKRSSKPNEPFLIATFWAWPMRAGEMP